MEPNRVRELIHDLSASRAKVAADGSLNLKNVKLLASGTWTDSNFGTPLEYSEDVLKEYATNWHDNPLWSRHGGGSPRSITDKIGEIVNQRYNAGAVVGDLILHGKTQTSRDTIELITAGLVNAVSVEHGGRESYDQNTGRYLAEEIIFYGAAIVNRGACSVCTINNEASRSSAEANDMDLKELAAKLAEAESKIKELAEASAAKDTKLSELESKLDSGDWHEENDEDMPDVAELEAKIADLEGRLMTIEKTPMPPATGMSGETTDLGEYDHLDPIQKDSEGITRRMF